ncbi:MAG: winged helix-turn-helix domain-containing protein [Myxococcaceae bacterium]
MRVSDESPVEGAARPRGRVRFGRFEFDPRSLELKESGSLVRLRQQPAKVLSVLLANPGGIVTREELRAQVWGSDTLVDFDQGLNYCVKEIRAALGDNADAPFYVETLPRRGYRWIGQVEPLPEPGSVPSSTPRRSRRSRALLLAFLGTLLAFALGAAAGVMLTRSRVTEPRWQRLTFRRGSIGSARFAPGGEVAYTAAWDGEPSRLHAGHLGAAEARVVTGDAAALGAVTARGEALYIRGGGSNMLARSPLAGGAEKALLAGVLAADATPDGNRIAAVHAPGDGTGLRVEFPLGTVIGRVNQPGALRISPSGRELAVIEHPLNGDDAGIVHLFGTGGDHRVLGELWGSLEGLAWSPTGSDVLVTAAREGAETSLYAISRETGKARLLLSTGGRLVIRDVAGDGRMLLERAAVRPQVFFGAEGQPECELTWLDGTSPHDLSPDGRLVLLAESGEGGGKGYSVYLRRTDCSPPMRLGTGRALTLVPDGTGALAAPLVGDDHIDLLPIGAGEVRSLRVPGIVSFLWAKLRPDGRLLFSGAMKGRSRRVWLAAPGGDPEPITPEQLPGMRDLLSPDGRTFVGLCPPRGFCLYPVGAPGEPVPVAALGQAMPLTWDTTGSTLVVAEPAATGVDLLSLEPRTGHRVRLRHLAPADPVGAGGIGRIVVTPDARAWAYTVVRRMSELYVVEGLSP